MTKKEEREKIKKTGNKINKIKKNFVFCFLSSFSLQR
jgi:hypothetical protein